MALSFQRWMLLPRESLASHKISGGSITRSLHFITSSKHFNYRHLSLYHQPLSQKHQPKAQASQVATRSSILPCNHPSSHHHGLRRNSSSARSSHIRVHRGRDVLDIEQSEARDEVLRKISNTLIYKSLLEGCLSWDIILYKQLMAITVSTIAAAKKGQAIQMQTYQMASALRFRDVKLRLVPADDSHTYSVQDLEAEITITSNNLNV